MASQPVLMPIAETLDRRLSIETIKARRTAIRELIEGAMKRGVHYNTIPGMDKFNLSKSGAEMLCSMFQLAPKVHVQDLSDQDRIRYHVRVELHSTHGMFCGEGVGTASSGETKYQWRGVICREEFDATLEDHRRVIYKRGKEGKIYTVLQIRTEANDQDNTILKMAKKRALVDAVLTVTACSDIFTQDLEEDDNGEDEGNGDHGNVPPATKKPVQPAQTPPAKTAPAQAPAIISEAQQRRFYAIAKSANKSDDAIKQYLSASFKIQHSRDLRREDYEAACAWASSNAPTQREPGQDDEERLEPFEEQF